MRLIGKTTTAINAKDDYRWVNDFVEKNGFVQKIVGGYEQGKTGVSFG